ncbi:MAG: hypothetical protein LBK50_03125, partial [Candidatus Nomurabacteria bacterium]|nr:hypothetical protein [Candidatus Nomurabacteria bacterium]
MVEYISKIPERPALVSRDAHRKAWISVTAPEKSELAILAKKYDLDADTLFDIFDDDEVTRLEHLDGHDYIFARFAVKTGDYSVATRPILLIASPNLTMTVAPEKPHIYDDML